MTQFKCSQKLENVARQLEAMAKELTSVIAQSGQKQSEEAIQLGEPTLSIYRYHRANIIDRNSSPIQGQSTPYALSLHLLLDSAELCLGANSSFIIKPDIIVVTMGNELQVPYYKFHLNLIYVQLSIEDHFLKGM